MIFFKLVSFPLCVIIILQERVKRTTSEIRLCHDRENGGPKYLLLAHGNHVRGIRSARIGSARMEATRYSPSLVLISFFCCSPFSFTSCLWGSLFLFFIFVTFGKITPESIHGMVWRRMWFTSQHHRMYGENLRMWHLSRHVVVVPNKASNQPTATTKIYANLAAEEVKGKIMYVMLPFLSSSPFFWRSNWVTQIKIKVEQWRANENKKKTRKFEENVQYSTTIPVIG